MHKQDKINFIANNIINNSSSQDTAFICCLINIGTVAITINELSLTDERITYRGGVACAGSGIQLNSIMTIYGLHDEKELITKVKATTTWMKIQDARQLKGTCTLFWTKKSIERNDHSFLNTKVPVMFITTTIKPHEEINLTLIKLLSLKINIMVHKCD